ncbi:MAG TPA: DUF4337 family protein [Gemmataceae bacterium]|nr:DUF4337 family protein [Gemmataceae bacterium]
MSSASSESAGSAAAKQEKPKSLWERLLSSMPVGLTVIATVLAGLSSSEMTQAQFHRSLAAQHQSKASDEWNFFQAKKLRSQNMELQAVMLRAASDAGPVDEKALRFTLKRLAEELAAAEKDAKRLPELIGRLSKPPNGALQSQAEALINSLAALHAELEKLRMAVDTLFGQAVSTKDASEAQSPASAFALLSAKDRKAQLPTVTDRKLTQGVVNSSEVQRIEQAYNDIAARKLDEDTVNDMRHLSEEAIKIVYTNALYNSRNFEQECDKFRSQFEAIDRLVEKQLEIAGEFERDGQVFMQSLPEAAEQDSDWKEVRTAAASLSRSQRAASENSHRLYRDYKSASDSYTARRYDKEANYNRATATVAEILVRKSGYESDRHRDRSKFFFYAMLLAQGGVTISTLALAIKRGSLLWGVASLAGLLAISFAAYVYTQM